MSRINIVIPLAGKGTAFKEAGYVFPKPVIDIKNQTMIEIVANNLKPSVDHRFIFICQRDQYEKYDFHNIFKRATNNMFEVVLLNGQTEGAACTVLTAIQYINNDDELIIANADQYIEEPINNFITEARKDTKDGLIMTFNSTHPRWSYVRTLPNNEVIETAEKRVISNKATVGIYYFKKGSDFIKGAQSMIKKNIRYNNEFYVCPVYNELILEHKHVFTYDIQGEKMFGLGTPEDVQTFIRKIDDGKITL